MLKRIVCSMIHKQHDPFVSVNWLCCVCSMSVNWKCNFCTVSLNIQISKNEQHLDTRRKYKPLVHKNHCAQLQEIDKQFQTRTAYLTLLNRSPINRRSVSQFIKVANNCMRRTLWIFLLIEFIPMNWATDRNIYFRSTFKPHITLQNRNKVQWIYIKINCVSKLTGNFLEMFGSIAISVAILKYYMSWLNMLKIVYHSFNIQHST